MSLASFPASSRMATVAGIPAAVLAAPCLACYAGVLSSLGLTAFATTGVQAALTVAFLAVPLVALGLRARERRVYGPLAAGSLGAFIVLVGKLGLDVEAVTYAGVAVLVLAIFWNVRRQGVDATFAGGTPAGTALAANRGQ